MKRNNETNAAPAILRTEYRDFERLFGMKIAAGWGLHTDCNDDYKKVSMRKHAEKLVKFREWTLRRIADLENKLVRPTRVKWDALHLHDQRDYERELGILWALETVIRIAEFLADEGTSRKEGHKVFLGFLDMVEEMFDKHCDRNGGFDYLANTCNPY